MPSTATRWGASIVALISATPQTVRYFWRSASITHAKRACRELIERASARHGALAVDARTAVTEVGTRRITRDGSDEGIQATARLTPFETVAQPAIVPALLMATATLGLGSSGLSWTIEPLASQVEATIEPDCGSKAAPTTIPLELTAVA